LQVRQELNGGQPSRFWPNQPFTTDHSARQPEIFCYEQVRRVCAAVRRGAAVQCAHFLRACGLPEFEFGRPTARECDAAD
jgi:hypothetical protein